MTRPTSAPAAGRIAGTHQHYSCGKNASWRTLPLTRIGASFVSYFLAQGFGTPLTTLAWPVLFVGLGGAFLTSHVLRQVIIGLVIGVLFVGMGFTPPVIQLRASPQRAVLGQFSAEGLQFVESDRARPGLMLRSAKKPNGAIVPTDVHWALSIGITTIAVLGGLLTAAA